MTKEKILRAYKESGYNAQDLMKFLDSNLGGSSTASYDGSLKVYQKGALVIMVSTEGVEFFSK